MRSPSPPLSDTQVTGDHGHYDGVVAELEARGAKVVPVFAGALGLWSQSIGCGGAPGPACWGARRVAVL